MQIAPISGPTNEDAINRRLSTALGALRWIAAALVLISHISSRVFANFPKSIQIDREVLFCGSMHLPVLMMMIALCNTWFDMPWSGRPVLAQAIWCFVMTTITLLALLGFHQVFKTKHMKLRFILLDVFNRVTNCTCLRIISLGDSKR